MAVVVQMPKLSDTMEEGAIASWQKKEGDFVEEGEVLVEIETDKATMDYESPEEGHLLKIVVPAGEKCELNAVIAVLGEKGESYEDLLKPSADPSADPSSSKTPESKSTENSDQKNAEQPAADSQNTAALSPSKGSDRPSSERLRASPLAKKMAADQGIDLSTVEGSGPRGRVVAKDLDGASRATGESSAAPIATLSAAMGSAAMGSAAVGDQKIKVSMMRSTIAKRLKSAKNDAPHFYLTRSVHMTNILNWRKSLNNDISPEKKVSVNDLMILCCGKALAKHPAVNSSWQGDHILQKGGVHVAFAVATEQGLVTPVVSHTNLIGVYDIAQQSKQLISQVKSGGSVDYTSGTFTISNLGMLGIEEFTAIINPPQAAILAVGATLDQPWVDEEGRLCVQKRMKVTMSCDHRVIDGAVGARFLDTLVRYMENPLMMLG